MSATVGPSSLVSVGGLQTAFGYALAAYVSTLFIFPLTAVYQEYKIWKRPLPRLSPWGMLKVYLFNVTWFLFTQVGAIVILPKWLLGMSVEKEAQCYVERHSGTSLVRIYVGPVVIKGKENLPPPNDDNNAECGGCVYIANHSSQIDAGVVYNIQRRFKWIAKKSIIYLPGVGQIMALGKHIFINRTKGTNRSNIKSMYEQSRATLQGGASMFVFPQGTRRMVERLPFKDGAFKIAIEAEVPIIPISIEIPVSAWNDGYPFSLLWGKRKDPIVLTVHKPVPVSRTTVKDKLKAECFETIYSVLPDLSGKQD